ncbi:hypothetical protein [Pleionea sediminis]|uniref:hypothetical protein n=1 Tax=Pleionea sediminis TaxID=2569479 RepID=UPI0011851113|nr:hypothetical protein [Pleionea sediminis]
MKLVKIFILFLILYAQVGVAKDAFIILYGNEIQPREGQDVSLVCYDNKEYKVEKLEAKGKVIEKIDVERYRPWLKLAYAGKCTGLKAINAKEAELDPDSPLNSGYLEQGISLYTKAIDKYSRYDKRMNDFYNEVKSDKFNPKFESVTNKWPLGGGAYLIEQCFSVSAKTKSEPSWGRDFVFGQKYKRTILDGDYQKVIMDTDLNFTPYFCECDENPRPTCEYIDRVTDINGNGKYEIREGYEVHEGMALDLLEFNGEDLSSIFQMCTGDFAYPKNDFSCNQSAN